MKYGFSDCPEAFELLSEDAKTEVKSMWRRIGENGVALLHTGELIVSGMRTTTTVQDWQSAREVIEGLPFFEEICTAITTRSGTLYKSSPKTDNGFSATCGEWSDSIRARIQGCQFRRSSI